jgi:hypothetical protein
MHSSSNHNVPRDSRVMLPRGKLGELSSSRWALALSTIVRITTVVEKGNELVSCHSCCRC